MKVHELIELLEATNPEAEVRLATQPNYPLAHTIAGVARNGEWGEWTDEDADWDFEEPDGEIVWIAAGGGVYDNPYAPRGIWEVV